MSQESDDDPTRGKAGAPRTKNGGDAGAHGARSDQDILAFFYADAGSAIERLRDDASNLSQRAVRLGRFVGEVGLDAAADARREFHNACELAERVSWLTFRLIDMLRADLDQAPRI